ncbi:MAG TPA: RNA polymerase sigma factor [Polyangia bacterium]
MQEEDVHRAYQTYAAAVYGRCRRLLRDDQAALDVTQEVFVRCFEKRGGLRASRELLAWLYRVATNLCLNALRDGRARHRLAETSFLPEEATVSAARVEGQAAATKIMNALQGLDSRAQAVAIYVYVDGMTHAEVAEVMGVTDRTVRNCLARFLAHGRRRLRLGPQEDFG